MASHHFIALIEQTRWRVVYFVGNNLHTLREFGIDDDSRMTLLRWWQQFPQAKISFLSNHADEQYHVEMLPHVRGAGGRQLLMRKLAAWPFAQGMHTVFKLDSVQILRREDRFLFVALVYPALSTWLTALQAQSKRIQGVYTQALTLPYWLPALPAGVTHRLCIQNTRQHVRLSYLQQHRLFFSRLIVLPQQMFTTPEEKYHRIALEASQLRMALIQQRWLPEEGLLQIVWMGQAPEDNSWLKKHLPASCVWIFVTEAELLRNLAGKSLPARLDPMDWVAMQAVLRGDPLPNLAPETVLLADSIARARTTLHWAGAFMAILMLLLNCVGTQSMQLTQRQITQVKHQLGVWQAANPTQRFRVEQLPQLRALTQAVQGLESSTHLPNRALSLLQNTLTGLAYWQLTALEWETDFSVKSVVDNTAHTMAGKEILALTWVNTVVNDEALVEWQQLLNRLRGLPEIDKVEEIRPSETATAVQRQGDTRHMLAPGQRPVLKLYLRHMDQAID